MKLLVVAALAFLLWRLFFAKPKQGPSPQEAARLLGISIDASPDEIRAAHRRLIARVHPDTGGTTSLANQINAARDILLDR